MKYPGGKLNSNDEGQLRIVTYIKDSRVIIDFGKNLSWLGFDKETLKAFIDGLQKQYEKL